MTMLRVLVIAFVAVAVASCSSKDTEARIAKLEGRVAELEARNGGGSTPPPSISSPTNPIPTPETKPEGPLPGFAWTQTDHDFGTINEGDIVDHVFTFTNNGEAPLIISSATASCGCTVPAFSKDPIPVGGSGEIKVQFNSRNKPGTQNKTVTVTANTFPKVTKLQIRANVVKPDQPS